MTPASSLARVRKHVLDLVATKKITAKDGAAQLAISPSRFYELKQRYDELWRGRAASQAAAEGA